MSAEAWMRQVAAAEVEEEARQTGWLDIADAMPLPTADPERHPTLPAPPAPTGPPSRRYS